MFANNTSTKWLNGDNPFLGQHINRFKYKALNISILVLSLLGVTLSFLAIFIIVRCRKLRKRTSNKFLVNLFVADLGVSVLMVVYHTMLFGASNKHERIEGVKESITFHMVISTFMFLSLVNRITVTLDRAIAVKKPFYYDSHFNSKMVLKVTLIQNSLAVVYLIIIVVAQRLLTDEDSYVNLMQLLFICVVAVGFIVLVVTNIVIYVEAKKQIVMICRITTTSSGEKRASCIREKECKIVRTNVGMVMLFVVCWTPFLVSICSEHRGKHLRDLVSASLILVNLNYILDPIIYVSLSKDVKDQIKYLLYKNRNRKNETSHSTTTMTTTESP